MGHLVKGDGADTISQSWNVPGSLNLGGFTFPGLPDKTGCLVRESFFFFLSLPKTRWFLLSGLLIFYPKRFKTAKQDCLFRSLMTQRIPQTKAGDVLVLETSIGPGPTRHRWDLRCVLSPPAVYTSPLCQRSTISQLLFSFESKERSSV